MPIKIPSDLPALSVLNEENIFVMDSARATSQDIRPLEVGILNLMPNKIQTEIQLCRLLSNTPLQINLDFIRIDKHVSKHTPKEHMELFYLDFEDIAHKKYDGLIITGAPVALMPYEEISYWSEITAIMDWAKRHVQSTLYLCWAAHAAMYHYYGITRSIREQKLFGVYEHNVLQPKDELLRGFDGSFKSPHSRYGYIPEAKYQSVDELQILVNSEEAGAYLVASEDRRSVFLTGHPEYDGDTLREEYERDLKAGLKTELPVSYFQNDNPALAPQMTWAAHGNLLYTNWLNYYVYQQTPYDLQQLSYSI